MADHPEHPVVGEVRGDQLVDLADGFRRRLLDVDHDVVRQSGADHRTQFVEIHSGVGVDDHQRRSSAAVTGVPVDLRPRVGSLPHAVRPRDQHRRLLVVRHVEAPPFSPSRPRPSGPRSAGARWRRT